MSVNKNKKTIKANDGDVVIHGDSGRVIFSERDNKTIYNSTSGQNTTENILKPVVKSGKKK